MSDHVRERPGVYRVPRARTMDLSPYRLALIAGGLLVALIAVLGIWSTRSHRSATVPIVEADSRPLRVKPTDAGGMQVGGQNDEILSGDGKNQTDALAPPPEAPAPAALRQLQAAPAPAPAAPPPLSTLATRTAPPSPAGHGPQVQLFALDSEAAAQTEWQKLARKAPGLLDSRHPLVTKIDRNGKPLWRVRADGFSTIAQATQFCEQVRAKGGSCSLATF